MFPFYDIFFTYFGLSLIKLALFNIAQAFQDYIVLSKLNLKNSTYDHNLNILSTPYHNNPTNVR